MSYPVFMVPAGDVLPVLFDTFDGGTGASITMTGLAVTDIEIYKDGSVTQRASDAGYTLLDTDGIDFDAITGIHGFSIDTGDNTDAGFYTVGAWFHVVVSAITVDAQTVNFVACAFRLMAAEGVAAVPDVNVTHVADTAQTAGDLKASLNTIDDFLDTEVAAILADTDDIQTRLPAALVGGRMDSSVGAMAADTLTASALAADAGNEIADAVLNRDMATGTDSGSPTVRTPRQALRALRNKVSIAAGTATITKEDDTTASWTAAVTTTAGDPISAVDPASA